MGPVTGTGPTCKPSLWRTESTPFGCAVTGNRRITYLSGGLKFESKRAGKGDGDKQSTLDERAG